VSWPSLFVICLHALDVQASLTPSRYFKGFVRAVQRIESMEEEMRADAHAPAQQHDVRGAAITRTLGVWGTVLDHLLVA
jgi:hypothetical protein